MPNLSRMDGYYYQGYKPYHPRQKNYDFIMHSLETCGSVVEIDGQIELLVKNSEHPMDIWQHV